MYLRGHKEKDYWNMKNLETRTSIRKYAQREVSNQLLHRLLSQAERTQTMGNLQLYSVVVTRDEAQKAALAPAHFNQPMITQAAVVLTFCADFRRFSQWCRFREAQPGYDNLQSFMWAVVDAVAATQNACIAAESMGLGICYLGTVTFNAHELIKIYQLPKGVVPVTCVTLGHPAGETPKNSRLPMDGVVHREFYQDYDESRIDAIYAERESSEETHQLLKENDLPNLNENTCNLINYSNFPEPLRKSKTFSDDESIHSRKINEKDILYFLYSRTGPLFIIFPLYYLCLSNINNKVGK